MYAFSPGDRRHVFHRFLGYTEATGGGGYDRLFEPDDPVIFRNDLKELS